MRAVAFGGFRRRAETPRLPVARERGQGAQHQKNGREDRFHARSFDAKGYHENAGVISAAAYFSTRVT